MALSNTLLALARLKIQAQEEALLTPREVAAITGLTYTWVRSLIRDGELRAINVGGTDANTIRWRVDPEDLNAWLKSRENRARDLVAS